MNKQQLGQLNVVESAIYGWLSNGVHPTVIATALNNAFAHGKALEEGNFECDNEVLGEIFDGIEKFTKGCKKVF